MHKIRNLFRAKTAQKEFRISNFMLFLCASCYRVFILQQPLFDENFMRFFWFGTVYQWDGSNEWAHYMRLLNAVAFNFLRGIVKMRPVKNVENLICLRCKLRHIDVFETSL